MTGGTAGGNGGTAGGNGGTAAGTNGSPGRPVLVLASASPARRATLVAAGIDPIVRVSGVDEEAETARSGLHRAHDVALLLARAKAEDVAAGSGLPIDALVLGCDSVLELDGEVYGKPADVAQARQRWQRMRGRSGLLHSGHWLIDARAGTAAATGRAPGRAVGEVASTVVRFADLSDAEIDAYLATGEPLGVAGGFTVDGLGGPFVTGIEGDYHAVVGLSLPLLRTLALRLGIPWPLLWRDALIDRRTTVGAE